MLHKLIKIHTSIALGLSEEEEHSIISQFQTDNTLTQDEKTSLISNISSSPSHYLNIGWVICLEVENHHHLQ